MASTSVNSSSTNSYSGGIEGAPAGSLSSRDVSKGAGNSSLPGSVAAGGGVVKGAFRSEPDLQNGGYRQVFYAQNPGQTQPAPSSPASQRAAILARPTVVQQLGQPAVNISYQQVNGRTQSVLPNNPVQPFFGLSPQFAGKAANALPGGVDVVQGPVPTLGPNGELRYGGSPVGVARIPQTSNQSDQYSSPLPAYFANKPKNAVQQLADNFQSIPQQQTPYGRLEAASPAQVNSRITEQLTAPLKALFGGYLNAALTGKNVEQQEVEEVSGTSKTARVLGADVGIFTAFLGGEGLIEAGLNAPRTAVALGEAVVNAPETVFGFADRVGSSVSRLLGFGEKAVVAVKESEPVVAEVSPAVARIVENLTPTSRVVEQANTVRTVIENPNTLVTYPSRLVQGGEEAEQATSRVVRNTVSKVSPAVQNIVDNIAPKAAPAVERAVPQGNSLSRALDFGFSKTQGYPKTIIRLAAGQAALNKIGLPLVTSQSDFVSSSGKTKLTGDQIVQAAQEAQQNTLYRQGSEIYNRDKNGNPISIKKPNELINTTPASPGVLGFAQGVGRGVSNFLEYNLLGGQGLGLQAQAAISNKLGSGKLSKERDQDIRDVGLGMGLSGNDLDEFIKKVRTTQLKLGVAEGLTSLYAVETATEVGGQERIGALFNAKEGEQFAAKNVASKTTAGALKNFFTPSPITQELFKTTAPTFIGLGALEGGAQYSTQVQTRGIKPTILGAGESVIGGAAISLGLGAGSVAFRATSPRVSTTLYLLGQAQEFPYELGGDLQAAFEKAGTRRLGFETLEPAIRPVNKSGETVKPSQATAFQFTTVGRRGEGVVPLNLRIPTLSFPVGTQASTSVSAPTSAPTSTKSSSNTPTSAQSVANALNGGLGIGVPVQSQIAIQQQVPIQQQTQTQVQTQQQTQTPVPIQQQTQTQVQTQQQTQTPVPIHQQTQTQVPIQTQTEVAIPVNTNVFGLRGLLPPVPLPLPGLSGQGGNGKGRKVFANELLAAQNLFGQQLGFGIQNLNRAVGRKIPKQKKQSQPPKNNKQSPHSTTANRLRSLF